MIFEDWGLISYEEAMNKQLEYVDKLDQALSAGENHPGFMIFCSHPAVVTTGRQTQPTDIFSWQGPVIEVSRGGRATYHGPSQIVVYPILSLKNPRGKKAESDEPRGSQDVRGYLRTFESAIVKTLKEFGITAEGKTAQKMPGQTVETDETGVWIGSQKIASLGIAVKKWITYHGAAINFFNDPTAFTGINPCGFKTETMISVEKVLGKDKITAEDFKNTLRKNLESTL
ncbi:lipoyl(octanoyl) transferase [Bdellovibrio sp. qaytius]|nr:lipoyl(octanoyl) transferase [Bdellovibrio sp. qaytius]